MDIRFENKVALVTGVAGGISLAAARILHAITLYVGCR